MGRGRPLFLCAFVRVCGRLIAFCLLPAGPLRSQPGRKSRGTQLSLDSYSNFTKCRFYRECSVGVEVAPPPSSPPFLTIFPSTHAPSVASVTSRCVLPRWTCTVFYNALIPPDAPAPFQPYHAARTAAVPLPSVPFPPRMQTHTSLDKNARNTNYLPFLSHPPFPRKISRTGARAAADSEHTVVT